MLHHAQSLLAAALAALAVGCAGALPAPAPSSTRTPPELLDFQDLLVPPGSCAAAVPERVGAAEAVDDLAVLERVLRRGYAGFEIRAREGLDWERLFLALRERVAAARFPMSVEEFRLLLLDGLAVVSDGHLALSWSDDAATHWGAALSHERPHAADVLLGRGRAGDWVVTRARGGPPEGARLLDCDARGPEALVKPTVTGDPVALAGLIVVGAAASPASLRCRFATARGAETFELPLHPVGGAPPARGSAFEQLRGPPVPVLRLRSLGRSHADALAAFVASAREVRGAPAIVLDLRGNTGGSDDAATDWFRDLTAGRLEYPTVEQLVTEVTLQGQVNDFTFMLEQRQLDDVARRRFESERAQARRELVRARERIGRAYREWRIRHPQVEALAPEPFAGRLVVLVDERCASACETMVMYARQLPGTLVVGSNTAGTDRFGEVRPYRLPHSRLWLQAGCKWLHDSVPGRVAPEGEGHSPDLWLDGGDPAAAAEAVARCTTQPACRTALDEGLARLRRSRDPAGPSQARP